MGNTIFTVRPKLLQGESLRSYLLRLANQNGISFLTVLNSIKTWEQKYVQRADCGLLDITPGSVLNMGQLSQLTGQSVEKLMDATFTPLMGRFGAHQEVQRTRFLSGMILDTYRFCPLCLKEALYYRLVWKLAPVTSCVQHEVFLIDECLRCKRQISFRDVERLDTCPHCEFSLSRSQSRSIGDSDRERQHWIFEALRALVELGKHRIEPHEVAMRLLYLLCGKQSNFDRQLVESALPSALPTLLQHARDSLSQKRTLHLSFLLNTLYEHHLSMSEFLQTTVPSNFVRSVKQGVVRKVDQLFCLAPWCNGNQRPGTLVQTGTTLKRRQSGETLLYYSACTECGCEYAINEDGELQERTYFIDGYQALQNAGVPLSGVKELARNIGFSEDRTRRCLAYFVTRLQSDDWKDAQDMLDAFLLKRVVNDVRKGTKLKIIQQWDCWESYQEFLVYRFHPEVMRAFIELKRPRPSKRSDSAVKREKVRQVLAGLLEKDEDITIAAVCDIVGVCPETIRSWGCNDCIAEAKQTQSQRRVQYKRNVLYKNTEHFLSNNQTNIITSAAMYDVLGVRRTVLIRLAPEMTAYIHERLVDHNRSVKEMLDQ